MTGRILVIVCVLLVHGVTAQKSRRVRVASDISLRVPEAFQPMNIEQQQLRYVTSRAPLAVFSSEDGNVELGINVTTVQWGNNDMEILKDFYRASLLSLYDRIDFIQDSLTTLSNRQFIVFEFVGTILNEDAVGKQLAVSRYIYIQYTIYEDRVILFNFSCPALIRDQWASTANEIMQSVRFK